MDNSEERKVTKSEKTVTFADHTIFQDSDSDDTDEMSGQSYQIDSSDQVEQVSTDTCDSDPNDTDYSFPTSSDIHNQTVFTAAMSDQPTPTPSSEIANAEANNNASGNTGLLENASGGFGDAELHDQVDNGNIEPAMSAPETNLAVDISNSDARNRNDICDNDGLLQTEQETVTDVSSSQPLFQHEIETADMLDEATDMEMSFEVSHYETETIATGIMVKDIEVKASDVDEKTDGNVNDIETEITAPGDIADHTEFEAVDASDVAPADKTDVNVNVMEVTNSELAISEDESNVAPTYETDNAVESSEVEPELNVAPTDATVASRKDINTIALDVGVCNAGFEAATGESPIGDTVDSLDVIHVNGSEFGATVDGCNGAPTESDDNVNDTEGNISELEPATAELNVAPTETDAKDDDIKMSDSELEVAAPTAETDSFDDDIKISDTELETATDELNVAPTEIVVTNVHDITVTNSVLETLVDDVSLVPIEETDIMINGIKVRDSELEADTDDMDVAQYEINANAIDNKVDGAELETQAEASANNDDTKISDSELEIAADDFNVAPTVTEANIADINKLEAVSDDVNEARTDENDTSISDIKVGDLEIEAVATTEIDANADGIEINDLQLETATDDINVAPTEIDANNDDIKELHVEAVAVDVNEATTEGSDASIGSTKVELNVASSPETDAIATNMEMMSEMEIVTDGSYRTNDETDANVTDITVSNSEFEAAIDEAPTVPCDELDAIVTDLVEDNSELETTSFIVMASSQSETTQDESTVATIGEVSLNANEETEANSELGDTTEDPELTPADAIDSNMDTVTTRSVPDGSDFETAINGAGIVPCVEMDPDASQTVVESTELEDFPTELIVAPTEENDTTKDTIVESSEIDAATNELGEVPSDTVDASDTESLMENLDLEIAADESNISTSEEVDIAEGSVVEVGEEKTDVLPSEEIDTKATDTVLEVSKLETGGPVVTSLENIDDNATTDSVAGVREKESAANEPDVVSSEKIDAVDAVIDLECLELENTADESNVVQIFETDDAIDEVNAMEIAKDESCVTPTNEMDATDAEIVVCRAELGRFSVAQEETAIDETNANAIINDVKSEVDIEHLDRALLDASEAKEIGISTDVSSVTLIDEIDSNTTVEVLEGASKLETSLEALNVVAPCEEDDKDYTVSEKVEEVRDIESISYQAPSDDNIGRDENELLMNESEIEAPGDRLMESEIITESTETMMESAPVDVSADVVHFEPTELEDTDTVGHKEEPDAVDYLPDAVCESVPAEIDAGESDKAVEEETQDIVVDSSAGAMPISEENKEMELGTVDGLEQTPTIHTPPDEVKHETGLDTRVWHGNPENGPCHSVLAHGVRQSNLADPGETDVSDSLHEETSDGEESTDVGYGTATSTQRFADTSAVLFAQATNEYEYAICKSAIPNDVTSDITQTPEDPATVGIISNSVPACQGRDVTYTLEEQVPKEDAEAGQPTLDEPAATDDVDHGNVEEETAVDDSTDKVDEVSSPDEVVTKLSIDVVSSSAATDDVDVGTDNMIEEVADISCHSVPRSPLVKEDLELLAIASARQSYADSFDGSGSTDDIPSKDYDVLMQSTTGVATGSGAKEIKMDGAVEVHAPADPSDQSASLDYFTGGSSWREYLQNFEAFCEANSWIKPVRASYLFAHLRGRAKQVACKLSAEEQRDFDQLVATLGRFFTARDEAELYLFELRNRVRRPKEGLRDLGQDIKRLTCLAYPEIPDQQRVRLARIHFLDSLKNNTMLNHIYLGKPDTLEQAIHLGIEYEGFQRIDTSEAMKATKQPSFDESILEGDKSAMEKRLEELAKGIGEIKSTLGNANKSAAVREIS